MKLTYIYHSGFAIESDRCNIIIDFFKDSESVKKGIVHDKLLKSDKKLYVLSTHSHIDHFNKDILKWKDDKRDIQYIFSKEILDNGSANIEDAFFLGKLDTFEDELIEVRAFGSTDIGSSFVIRCDGKTIFHAGDLNNWHWDEESTKEEIEEAERNYLNELNLLSEHFSYFDLVMFPVDIRLGKNYMKGALQFIDKIKVGIFVPMHFGKNYESANKLKNSAIEKGVRFFEIIDKGDSIIF